MHTHVATSGCPDLAFMLVPELIMVIKLFQRFSFTYQSIISKNSNLVYDLGYCSKVLMQHAVFLRVEKKTARRVSTVFYESQFGGSNSGLKQARSRKPTFLRALTVTQILLAASSYIILLVCVVGQAMFVGLPC